MKVLGTGGISDVITYLEKRRNIQRKLENSKRQSISMKTKMQSQETNNKNIKSSIAHLILSDLDNRKIADFLNYFSEEASFSFGSQEVVKGRKNIEFYVESFLQGMKTIQHKINSQSTVGSKLIVEGFATYVTTENLDVTLPFCDVWTFDQASEKIIDYRVYCDPTPLMN